MAGQVFVSSSSDTLQERRLAIALIDQLGARLGLSVGPDDQRAYAYERDESIEATARPIQDQIRDIGDQGIELVVFIFGERVGLPLPPDAQIPDKVKRLIDLPEWRRHFSYSGQENADPNATPLTGTLYELFAAIAFEKSALFFCKGPRAKIFDTTLPSVWHRSFGNGSYATSYNLKPGEKRGHTEEERKYVESQLRGIQRLYDYVLATRGGRQAFDTLNDFEELLSKKLRAHWKADFDPYAELFQGLEPYGLNQAPIYWGRDKEVKKAIELLRARHTDTALRPRLLVTGRSGVGKSSFAAAGLAAKLADADSDEVREIGFRLKPVFLNAGSLTAEEGTPPVLAAARVIAEATDETIAGLLVGAGAQSLNTETLVQMQRLATELRHERAKESISWLPLIVVDQVEDAFGKGGSSGAAAFERQFGPIAEYLDALASHRLAWVVYILADTSRSTAEATSDGWLKLWNENPTIQRLNGGGVLSEPLALQSLSSDALERIFASTFARAAVDIDPAVLEILHNQIADVHASDRNEGFAPESILPLLSVSMQLSEQRRLDRLRSLIAHRKLGKEPLSRAAWLATASQDVRASSLVEEDEAQLRVEDFVPLPRSIEILAERAFEKFVNEELQIDWAAGEFNETEFLPAPRSAEVLLHKLLRWLVSLPNTETKTLDHLSTLSVREAKRPTVVKQLGEHGEALVVELSQARLLRTDRQTMLRLSHVALIRHWRRARNWCLAEQKHLQTYSEVQSLRSKPTESQLRAIRALYVAWGYHGPWAPQARTSRSGAANTDREWVREQIREAALKVTNPDIASGWLYAAMQAGDDSLTEELLKAFSRVRALSRVLDLVCHPNVDPRQPPPVVLAAELGLRSSLAFLAASASRPFAIDRNGQSAFHKLATSGDAEGLAHLVKRLPRKKKAIAEIKPAEWPPSRSAYYGWTPLHLAAKSGELEAVKVIVGAMQRMGIRPAARIHLKASRFGGATPLHFASRQHKSVATPMLREIFRVTRGKDVDDPRGISDSSGYLPLHVAAANNDYEAVSLLIGGRRSADAQARTAPDEVGARHTALSIAARRGAIDAMQALLDADIIQASGWPMGREALRLAAGYGHEGVVAQLLQRGAARSLADLLDADDAGRNALHLASQFRRVLVLKLFLEHRDGLSLISAPDSKRGRTPLHWACFYNDPNAESTTRETVTLLLSSEADRCARDVFGMTPLQLALRRRVRAAYEMLGERFSAEELGEAGLHDLLQTRDEDFILRVIGSCPNSWLDVRDENDRTLLHRAAFMGLRSVVAELVSRAPQLLNAKDKAQRTAIHEASCSRSPLAGDIVDFLVANGGSVFELDIDSRTALQCAAFNANAGVCQTLLAAVGPRGGDLLIHADKFGKTALHCAAEAGDGEAADVLLAAGADPLARANPSEGARTPAHLAAYYGSVPVLIALSSANPAALDEPTGFGDTLLHCAASGSRLSVVDWIVTAHKDRALRDLAIIGGANHNTPFGAALMSWAKLRSREAKNGSSGVASPASAQFKPTASVARDVVDRLQALLPEVYGNSLPDDPSMTAAAVRAGDMDLLRSLVEQGAPVVAVPGTRHSPLHKAIELRDEGMARNILRVGGRAAAISTNHHGRTPLHLAALLGMTELVDPLIDAGAPIDAEDRHGRTAADLALSVGNIALVDQLRVRAGDGVTLFKGPPTTELARELFEAVQRDDAVAVGDFLAKSPAQPSRSMALRLSCAWGAINTLRTHFTSDDPMLLEPNEAGDFALLRAARFGRASVLEWAADSVVNQAATMNLARAETLLHIAARYGHTAVCQRLVFCGADQVARDSNGRTPLHRAAVALRAETVTFLAEAAAARMATDSKGRTALHVAAHVRVDPTQEERAEAQRATIAALLDAGVDPTALDADGRTAEELAAQRGETETAAYIQTAAIVPASKRLQNESLGTTATDPSPARKKRHVGIAMLVVATVLLLGVAVTSVVLLSGYKP